MRNECIYTFVVVVDISGFEIWKYEQVVKHNPPVVLESRKEGRKEGKEGGRKQLAVEMQSEVAAIIIKGICF